MFALDLSYLWCLSFCLRLRAHARIYVSNFSSDFNCRPAAMRRFATKVGLQLRGFEQPNSGGRVAVKDRCSFEDHVRCRTFIGASMKR